MSGGQTRGDDDDWLPPALKPKKKPVSFYRRYEAVFSFTHGHVLCQLLTNDQNQDVNERILPSGASVEETCNHAEGWARISFDDEDEFTEEVLLEIQRKLELLDCAVDAMLKK